MRDIRYVVLHAPGPRWKAGLPFFEQEGVQEHVAHFRQWLAEGRLALGGPFLDEHAGGMMISTEGLGEDGASASASDESSAGAVTTGEPGETTAASVGSSNATPPNCGASRSKRVPTIAAWSGSIARRSPIRRPTFSGRGRIRRRFSSSACA